MTVSRHAGATSHSSGGYLAEGKINQMFYGEPQRMRSTAGREHPNWSNSVARKHLSRFVFFSKTKTKICTDAHVHITIKPKQREFRH